MKDINLQSLLFWPLVTVCLVSVSFAQSVSEKPPKGANLEKRGELVFGIKDFEMLPAEGGRTKYHIDKWRPTFSINAGDKTTHGKFARAKTTFARKSGVYSVKITTITEFDGESQYRLLVDGKVVAEFKNPRVDTKKDMKSFAHVWTKISLKTGSKVAVESAVASNGLIPEGDGFAYARGRWKSLEFIPAK